MTLLFVTALNQIQHSHNLRVLFRFFFVIAGQARNLWFVSIIIIPLAISCLQVEIPAKPKVNTSKILAVVTGDFTVGSLSILQTDDHFMAVDIGQAHADAVVKFSSDEIFIVNRLGRDALFQYHLNGISEPRYRPQVLSFDTKSNPQDVIRVNEHQVAVAYLNKSSIEIIHLNSKTKAAIINIESFADADGYPEVNMLFVDDNYLYATLQRLDRNNTANGIWPPVGTSFLLKINLSNLTIEKSFTTPFSNPISKIRKVNSKLYFSAPGNMAANYQLDGGVVIFDLISEQFITHNLKETVVGYEIFDAIMCDETTALVLASDDMLNSRLLAVDVTAGNIIKTLAQHSYASGGYFASIEADCSAQQLFLADRNIHAAGIRIFDIMSLEEITPQALSTGLPPFALDFRP